MIPERQSVTILPGFDVDLEWITVCDISGAEHYIAESGWLLARIQWGPGSVWNWSVSTISSVRRHGTTRNLSGFERESALQEVAGWCINEIINAYSFVEESE